MYLHGDIVNLLKEGSFSVSLNLNLNSTRGCTRRCSQNQTLIIVQEFFKHNQYVVAFWCIIEKIAREKKKNSKHHKGQDL